MKRYIVTVWRDDTWPSESIRPLPEISDEELGHLALDYTDTEMVTEDIGAAIRKALLGEPA